MAEFVRGHAVVGDKARERGWSRGMAHLHPDDTDSGQIYGMSCLSAALQSASLARASDALDYLGEAAEISATFQGDVARGLSQERGHEESAVSHLLEVESLARQAVHTNPCLRATVVGLLPRTRGRAGQELHGLAHRMGNDNGLMKGTVARSDTPSRPGGISVRAEPLPR